MLGRYIPLAGRQLRKIAAYKAVYIGGTDESGGIILNASNPYYHNGENGNIGTADNNSTGANATFEESTGTLTLNGLNINAESEGISWWFNENGAHDLKIILSGGSTNTITSSSIGIRSYNGNPGNGPSLIIEGSGTLNVTGNESGI